MVNRILSVVGWIGTVLVFGAVAVRFLRPEWNQYATWAAWAGLVAILLYMAGQWREIGAAYGKRQMRYGTLSIVSIAVVLAILAAVNYLAVRQSKRWDLTANQAYSLSEQSIKVLQGLDAPVKLTVFDQETNFDRFRERLDVYQYHSDKLTVEYVDMDRQPARAKTAQVQNYGTVVLEYKDRTERITATAEQDITNALIKAVTGETRKVYFTQGHGEKDTAGSDRVGYATVAQALTRDNYGVEKLVLVQQREVPADATMVIVAGPRTDFLQPEIDALTRYVAKGGKVLFLLDPEAGDETAPLPNVSAFLNGWGITMGNDIVVDASGIGRMLGTDASVPVAASYPPHAITEGFNLMTAFPLARSITAVQGGANGRTAQPLVETGPQSWAETSLSGLGSGGQVEMDDKDRPGPIALAAAVSAPATDAPAKPEAEKASNPPTEPEKKPESRIIVVGDSDFAANYGLGIQGNRDFFMNAVNWLAQSENLIAIRPREAEDRRITLTADQSQRIMLLSIFIIPGLVLATGVYTWWRRR
jgi:ABC-type uncharacterized transport system involved in gliding motility auxiliary subunit